MCQVRLILLSRNLSSKNNISLVKTVLKTPEITANFVKPRNERKKRFPRGGTLSRIPLRPVLISI